MPSLKKAEARAKLFKQLEDFAYKYKYALKYKGDPTKSKWYKFPTFGVSEQAISSMRLEADRIIKAIKKKKAIIEDQNGFEEKEWGDGDDY
jgi:hypothetical protein